MRQLTSLSVDENRNRLPKPPNKSDCTLKSSLNSKCALPTNLGGLNLTH